MSVSEVVRTPTDYGNRFDGILSADDRAIRTTLRAPEPEDWSGMTYVMVNGWTGGKNSMRNVALAAVEAGHAAVTFDYTNRQPYNALLSNAIDTATVIDSLPYETRRSGIGLSMGGSVLTMAIEKIQSRLESATLVAPAQYIIRRPTFAEIVQHFMAESRELTSLAADPLQALRLAAGVARNVAERPRAVRAELVELTSSTVRHSIPKIKSSADAPYIRFMYGRRDRLIPEQHQQDGIADLTFDEVVAYDGEHMELAKGRELGRWIFSLEAERQGASADTEQLSLAS